MARPLATRSAELVTLAAETAAMTARLHVGQRTGTLFGVRFRWISGAFVAALCVAASGALRAQSGTPALGPKDGAGMATLDTGRVGVGASAPDFTLEAKDGPAVTLSQFRGKKTVVLVFYRGHW